MELTAHPADADLLVLPSLDPGVAFVRGVDVVAELNGGRELHRRLARAAAALIATFDQYPGDAVPRDVLVPALDDVRFLAFRSDPAT